MHGTLLFGVLFAEFIRGSILWATAYLMFRLLDVTALGILPRGDL